MIENKIDAPEYAEDEIIERQFKVTAGSVSKESCRVLLERGSYKSKKYEGLVGLTRDIRLKFCILLHSLPHEFLLELATQIKCEVLNVKARPGMYYENPQYYQQTLDIVRASAKRLQYVEVPGTHHAHLNGPQHVADIVTEFLSSNITSKKLT